MKIKCLLRNCDFLATPEEVVRQLIIRELLDLGYPKELMIVERNVSELSQLFLDCSKIAPKRRVDILCCGKQTKTAAIFPLLLIECKAGPLTEKALRQVGGYNHFIGAPLYAVVNKEKRYVRAVDKSFLPDFDGFSIPQYSKVNFFML